MSLSDSIQIDDANDMIVAYGQPMTGDFLRMFAAETPADCWFRIVLLPNGALGVETTVLERPRLIDQSH